jgi:hypothetical protein
MPLKEIAIIFSSFHGRDWRPLNPDPALHEAPDTDREWNALSLPFVVGPNGRIGKLNPKALGNNTSSLLREGDRGR